VLWKRRVRREWPYTVVVVIFFGKRRALHRQPGALDRRLEIRLAYRIDGGVRTDSG